MKTSLHIAIRIIAVLFLIIFLPELKAQSSDSVDLKYLVQKQIEEAKKKNTIAPETEYQTPIVKTPVKNAVIETNHTIGIPDSYFYKGLILLLGAVAAFSWVSMRNSQRKKVYQKNQFKRNIKLMREEKFIKEIDPKLKEIRTRLTLTSVVLNEDNKVSAAARRSQIGKEEILLASRIRSREMQYGRQRSLA